MRVVKALKFPEHVLRAQNSASLWQGLLSALWRDSVPLPFSVTDLAIWWQGTLSDGSSVPRHRRIQGQDRPHGQ